MIEKIYDPRTDDYFYYNKVTTESRWTKAKCLGNHDIENLAATYTEEQGALMIQSALRRKFAKKRVRKLYAMIVSKVYDEYTDAYYYYNADTGEAFWDKPLILGSQDLEDILQESEEDISSDDAKETGASGSDEEEAESDEEESENDDDYASSGGSDEGKAARDYPRSKMQMLVDEAEDVEEGPQRLNVSGIGTCRISARIYDMVTLTDLDISQNSIARLSEDIGNLVNLTALNLGHNHLREVPVELEEHRLADLGQRGEGVQERVRRRVAQRDGERQPGERPRFRIIRLRHGRLPQHQIPAEHTPCEVCASSCSAS